MRIVVAIMNDHWDTPSPAQIPRVIGAVLSVQRSLSHACCTTTALVSCTGRGERNPLWVPWPRPGTLIADPGEFNHQRSVHGCELAPIIASGGGYLPNRTQVPV